MRCFFVESDGKFKISKSKEIDEYLLTRENDNVNTKKVLMIGTKGSGRKKFAKFLSLNVKNKPKFTDEELQTYKSTIIRTCISVFKIVVSQLILSPEENDMLQESIRFIINIHPEVSQMDDQIINNIKYLISNPVFHTLVENSFKAQILRRSQLFFIENASRFIEADYIPTVGDVIAIPEAKSPNGIIEITFTTHCTTYKFIDVSKIASDRRLWFHCFEDVEVVVFITAMSDYNVMVDLEDGSQITKLKQSVNLFVEFSCYDLFKSIPVFLVLTKIDAFFEKLRITPFESIFPLYSPSNIYGSDDNEKMKNYIKTRFLNPVTEKRKIVHTHYLAHENDFERVMWIIDSVLRCREELK